MPAHRCSYSHRSRYRPVIFRDAVTGDAFLTRSTMVSNKRLRWSDGRDYPVVDLDLSRDEATEVGAKGSARA